MILIIVIIIDRSSVLVKHDQAEALIMVVISRVPQPNPLLLGLGGEPLDTISSRSVIILIMIINFINVSNHPHDGDDDDDQNDKICKRPANLNVKWEPVEMHRTAYLKYYAS